MRVVTHEDFLEVYTRDSAAVAGRLEAILEAVRGEVAIEEATAAGADDIEAIHTAAHIASVSRDRLYKIAALAAGASIQAALTGLTEPCFALVRPPGHHASAGSSWGFCYFNNMAIALDHLKREGHISSAYVLDFDLHFGDGTVSILGGKGYTVIHNPEANDRHTYLNEVAARLTMVQSDIIGVSAGFDNHLEDWGGLLYTEDYQAMGRMLRETCQRLSIGCFAVLEGGYNHQVIGQSVLAFIRGLQGL